MIHYLPFILLIIIPCERPLMGMGAMFADMCVRCLHIHTDIFLSCIYLCFLYFLVGQKFLRKLPHAKSPFKMPYELLMDVANNDPVPLLPTSLLPCPPSFKGIRGSRGVKLSESDLPCTCESSVNFWSSPCLSFLIQKREWRSIFCFILRSGTSVSLLSFIGTHLISRTALKTACRVEDKLLSTEALQSLILPELSNFVFHCFHCTQPSSKTLLAWPQTCSREEMTKFTLCGFFFLLWWIGKTGAGGETHCLRDFLKY